jgi:hypothetical protein
MGYQKGISIAQDVLFELIMKDSIQDKLSSAYSKIKSNYYQKM